MDRTVKALLLFIALGLWAHVIMAWLPPVSAAETQGSSQTSSLPSATWRHNSATF